MKRTLRILVGLIVATMVVGGGMAGSAAAQDTTQMVSDNDLADIDVNAGNVNTALAVNAANLGGSQDASAMAGQVNDAGDSYDFDA